jgi:hypothetical protein
LSAKEVKATKRPSALTAASWLGLLPAFPFLSTLTRSVIPGGWATAACGARPSDRPSATSAIRTGRAWLRASEAAGRMLLFPARPSLLHLDERAPIAQTDGEGT